MRTLASTLESFRPPDVTPGQARRAEEFERRERDALVRERLGRAGIPAEFRGADLSECDPAVSAWASSMGRGLLLKGEPGRGKTHAACAVLRAKAAEMSVSFVTVSRLLDECREAMRGEGVRSVKGRYSATGLLVIDDLGKERLTEWSLPVFFDVIDRRSSGMRPTIITTNYSGEALMRCLTAGDDVTTAKALASRLRRYEQVVLSGPDRRGAS